MITKKKINFSEKIFIAGATGMVGSAVKRALKKQGYGSELKGGKIFSPTRKELNLVNEEEIKFWFNKNKPTIVIIAAARVGGIIANASRPADFLLENLQIQTNIINAAWKSGVKRLLFLGSSCIYPKLAKQPIEEESLMSGELEKTNEWYAIAKISGIKLCQSLREQYGFDAISLMPTNLFGPGDNYHPVESHVVASLLMKFLKGGINSERSVLCWGSGKALREFMHVDDLANAIIFALENWDPSDKNAPHDKYGMPLTYLNVGTGKDISIYDLAKKIAFLTNYNGEIIWDHSKPDGTPKKLLNIERITKLGWFPKIKLEEGLKRTINELKDDSFKAFQF